MLYRDPRPEGKDQGIIPPFIQGPALDFAYDTYSV